MLFDCVYILSTKPLIISYLNESVIFKGDKLIEGDKTFQLPSWFKPKYILKHITWWQNYKGLLRIKLKQIMFSLDSIKMLTIVNAADEEKNRKLFLMPGGHFNHNIYINETLYKIIDEEKKYDAIYTAQLLPFKRHALAKEIQKLMIVSYGGDLPAFCPELSHAEYNTSFLPREELARKYNQSFCGLCLSSVEGAMLASTEYLLCGIPVVSTPSKGGRDEFFTKENSIIVNPDAGEIKKAVEYWKNNPPDKEMIRNQVLEKINRDRLAYCTFIANLIKKSGGKDFLPEKLFDIYFSPPTGINKRLVYFKDLINLKENMLEIS